MRERIKKVRKRDKYLIASMAAIVAFAVAVLALSSGDHVVPDALIYGWYTFWAVEIYQIARITINKGKEEDNDV